MNLDQLELRVDKVSPEYRQMVRERHCGGRIEGYSPQGNLTMGYFFENPIQLLSEPEKTQVKTANSSFFQETKASNISIEERIVKKSNGSSFFPKTL